MNEQDQAEEIRALIFGIEVVTAEAEAKVESIRSAEAQARASAAIRADFDRLFRTDAHGRMVDRRGKPNRLSAAIGIGIAAALALSGCRTNPATPTVPEVTRVKVSERARLPAWALDELDEHPEASQRVGDKLEAGEARREEIRAENCRKRLLLRLDAGEAVDPRECGT